MPVDHMKDFDPIEYDIVKNYIVADRKRPYIYKQLLSQSSALRMLCQQSAGLLNINNKFARGFCVSLGDISANSPDFRFGRKAKSGLWALPLILAITFVDGALFCPQFRDHVRRINAKPRRHFVAGCLEFCA